MDATLAADPRVALQQNRDTIPPAAPRPLWTEQPPWGWQRSAEATMTDNAPRKFCIQGVTREGKTFRPSDWAERLAGAMSSFRPEGSVVGRAAFLGYSPYCEPRLLGGVSSVIVDEALRGVEPMAWDFVMSFARDNNLVVLEPGKADPPRP
jgi:hypothetical protein